jgi:hypothetical protein
MNEEVSKVLKMLEEGKIDSEKAAALIDALNNHEEFVATSAPQDKMLKVKVISAKGDNVNVNIPVKFINSIGSAIKRIPKIQGVEGIEEIDIQAILEAVGSGLDGKIVDVKSENGDIVEVIIE